MPLSKTCPNSLFMSLISKYLLSNLDDSEENSSDEDSPQNCEYDFDGNLRRRMRFLEQNPLHLVNDYLDDVNEVKHFNYRIYFLLHSTFKEKTRRK
jgi:hypothetical protein